MSIILLPGGEEFHYTKNEVVKYFEELLHAGYIFVGEKEETTFNLIIHNILTPDFRKRFKVDMFVDLYTRDTRFHDLALMAKMWCEIKEHLFDTQGLANPEVAMKDPDSIVRANVLGQSMMQDMADHTAKVMHKDYPELEEEGFIWDRKKMKAFEAKKKKGNA